MRRKQSLLKLGLGISLALLALGFVHAAPGHAAPPHQNQQVAAQAVPPTNPNGPLWMVISLDGQSFAPVQVPNNVNNRFLDNLEAHGSESILVQVGNVFSDGTVEGVKVDDTGLQQINVPLDGLAGQYAAAALGSYYAAGGYHMLTGDQDFIGDPSGNALPARVQEAFFNAAPTLGALLEVSPFPTSAQIAGYVYEQQFETGAPAVPVEFGELYDALFGQMVTDEFSVGCTTCSGVGDLFPHNPTGRIYQLEIEFDSDDGTVSDLAIARYINIDIKGNNPQDPLNLGSNGLFRIVIASQTEDPGSLDATLIDPTSVYLDLPNGKLYAAQYQVKDGDGDGDTDLVVKFATNQLVSPGGLAPSTDTLRLVAEALESATGTQIEFLTGVDDFWSVPPTGN